MLIIQSRSTDVYRNLAVEEWLLDHAPQLPVLFLCVNDPCVVIGKNQNPWRECRLSLMEKEGVPLARRISGGGAVYHDPGNLNVSVIVPRTEYVEQKQYDLVFQTLETFGVAASKVRKNTLAVGDKKISGQAFCFRGGHVLHHGTLLVNADLNRLGRYLGPEVEGIETKAVASVPAQVANLSQFAPELTVKELSAALIDCFQSMYAPESSEFRVSSFDFEIPEEQLLPMIGPERSESGPAIAGQRLEGVAKISSNDWKLGHTPRFQVEVNGCTLEVEKGRVVNLEGAPLFEEILRQSAC